MSTTSKPRLDTETVLRAAEELVEAAGYDALTMTSLATQLGTKASSLYNHVSGLDDVRALIQIRTMARLGAELKTAAMGRSGADGIRQLALTYRDFAQRNPQLYQAMTRTPIERDRYWAAANDAQSALAVMVTTAGIPHDRALASELAFFTAIHGFVGLEVNGFFGDLDVSDAFEQTLRGAVTALVLQATTTNG